MELSRLVYEDFYKFVLSLGVLFCIAGSSACSYMAITADAWDHSLLSFFIMYILVIIAGAGMMMWSASRWYSNQRLLDRKLRAETRRKEYLTEISRKDLDRSKKVVNERYRTAKRKQKEDLKGIMDSIDEMKTDLMKIKYLLRRKIDGLLLYLNFKDNKSRTFAEATLLLEKAGIYNKSIINMIKEIACICNRALHGEDVSRSDYTFVKNFSHKLLVMMEETLAEAKE